MGNVSAYGDLFRELILLLTRVADAQMPYHCWRVALLCDLLSHGQEPHERSRRFFAALLHDIGALGLEEGLFSYDTILDAHLGFMSWGVQSHDDAIIYSHPERGAELAVAIPFLGSSAELIRLHHERTDGGGFPAGLTEAEIPEASQCIRIADSYDILLRCTPLPSFHNVVGRLKKKPGEVGAATFDAFLELLGPRGWFYLAADEPSLVPAFLEAFRRNGQGIFDGAALEHVEALLSVFSSVIDSRHLFMAGHSSRVARYSGELAAALRLSPDEVRELRWAALLHDMGRIFIPRKVMAKPEKLDEREMRVVKEHPVVSMRFLKTLPGFSHIAEIAGHHHERFDGTGYPDALAGEAIPLGSRILALCDLFDAVTSDRAYRKAMPSDLAFKIIRKNAGSQLDPALVDAAQGAFAQYD